jgi:hypothetical protein
LFNSKQKLHVSGRFSNYSNGNKRLIYSSDSKQTLISWLSISNFSHTTGTQVEELNATDLDTGENAEIVYRIQQGSFNDFQIDNRSGVITIAKPLDYDIRQNYTLEIVASDKGIPSLSGELQLFPI